MPRISSEKTRQVILVKDPVFDDDIIPERIALFDEDHQMVSINLVNKGPWIATSAYAENEIVTYDGGSYLAKQPIAANLLGNPTPPTDTDTWTTLAEKGAPGIIGLTWQDDWESTVTYVYRDAVAYHGSSYMARYENTNVVPDTPAGVVYAPDGSTPASLIIPSDAVLVHQTPPNVVTSGVYWWKFTVAEAGTFTATVDPTSDPYMSITNSVGTAVSGGAAARVSSMTVTLSPGVYYVKCQQYSLTHSSDWQVTLSPAAKLVEPLGAAWLLLAEKGEDGPQGIQGETGPPGPIARWRGDFNGAIAYTRGDTVFYDGESWWATENMTAGAAPVPGVAFTMPYLGDNPASGSQWTYGLPLGYLVTGPLAHSQAGYAVSGAYGVNWFRVTADPGSTVTITPSAAMFNIWNSVGGYSDFGSNKTAPYSFTMPAAGLVYLEVGPNPGASSEPVTPWTIHVAGTPNPAYPFPTWARVVEKGADGAVGDEGPEGPEGPQGPAGVGAGGTGQPTGGTAGQVLTKNSGTDYDASYADIPEPPPAGVVAVTAASLAEIGPTATGDQYVGPELAFTVGASGMVILHASCEWRQPPGSVSLQLLVDGALVHPTPGGIGNTVYYRYDLWVGGLWTPSADMTAQKGGIPGVMLALSAGAHTARWALRSNGSGGGYGRNFRLAALPL